MDQPPGEVAAELKALNAAVSAAIPAKTTANLLVGSWNLRGFADINETWDASPNTSPKRGWRAVADIAVIVSRFDVVAVQEVRRDVSALRFLLERLGDDWRFITTDVTEGDGGNGERLTFLYDSTRIQPSGLVGEIVLPDDAKAAGKQFARTPYAASFTRNDVEFILATVHIVWGTGAGRIPEITAFAEWMGEWAKRKNDWNGNLLVLGDFNLDRFGDPMYEAFVSSGLTPPTQLRGLPRTIFDDPQKPHFYDQIAWFSTGNELSVLDGLTFTDRAGSFDFVPHVFAGMNKTDISWRVSDHLPLWCEFKVAARSASVNAGRRQDGD